MQIQHICGRTSCIDTGHELITIYKIDEKNLHIDHVLNNQAFYDRYRCDILAYSTDIEDFVKRRNPQYPYRQFELAPGINIEGVEIGIIHTPGHSPDHIALVTPDNVCCLGDAIISHPLLESSKLPYIEDVERAILTMEEIRHMPYDFYVVSHQSVIAKEELSELIDGNIQKELVLYDILRRQITAPTTMDEAVDNFMLSINISAARIAQMPYMRETVKARIRTLAESGECIIQDDKIFPASTK